MAITKLTLACDSSLCDAESSDFERPEEALELGWYIVQGPERDLGLPERVYCSKDCLVLDLA